jgi:phage tail-like protein
MSIRRDTPYTNFNFLVDLGTGDPQGPAAGFEEVTLPEMWVDVIEYREGNQKANDTRKLTGLAHYGNVTLKRGVAGDLSLYAWFDAVRNGEQGVLRTVTIQLQNENHSAVVQTWSLLRARPVRIRWGPLNAKGKETAVEYLELACERIELE